MSGAGVAVALSTSERFITLRRFLISTWLAFSTIFVAGRVGSYGPNHGDVAIWIPMHEWMARGETLYETVWDNKDWGFFWLPQLLYRLWGIEGLYLAGFLAVAALSVGIYLLVQPFMTPGGAASLAATGAIVYTSSPSFWSIFTENLGIGLVVLAFGLLLRYPFFGGLTWSIAASVKLAGGGLFLFTMLGLVVIVVVNRHHQHRAQLRGRILRAVAGFLLGTLFVLALAASTGSLWGWLDIISYNREYASIRGFPPAVPFLELPLAAVSNSLLDVSQLGQHQLVFGLALCLSSVSLSVLILSQRKAMRLGTAEVSNAKESLFLLSILLLGSLALTLSQRPSTQHWQYVVGPAVALTSFLYALLYSARPKHASVLRVLGIGLLILPFMTSVFFDRTMLPRGILDRGIALTYFAQGGIFGEELAAAPPESSFASFTINDERIDVSQLPPRATLACPFVVQFSFFFPRYDQDLRDCIEMRPDLVVLGAEPWASATLRNEITSVVEEEYELCAQAGSTHELWVRAEVGCGFLGSSASP